MATDPTHGYTSDGTPVHAATMDHHKADSAVQRFNKRMALWTTSHVGTMWCAYIFTVGCLLVVPSCLHSAGWLGGNAFYETFGFNLLLTLILSTYLELVLLPVLMVGQNLQNEAADARAKKQFEDIEAIAQALDLKIEGGLTQARDEIIAAINKSPADTPATT